MNNNPERMRAAIAECREMVDAEKAEAVNTLWAGELEDCGVCGEAITPELEFFADAELYPDEGVWGLLCPLCLTDGGNEIAWGRASYTSTALAAAGSWLRAFRRSPCAETAHG